MRHGKTDCGHCAMYQRELGRLRELLSRMPTTPEMLLTQKLRESSGIPKTLSGYLLALYFKRPSSKLTLGPFIKAVTPYIGMMPAEGSVTANIRNIRKRKPGLIKDRVKNSWQGYELTDEGRKFVEEHLK